jgi:hypothetical protein
MRKEVQKQKKLAHFNRDCSIFLAIEERSTSVNRLNHLFPIAERRKEK